MVEFLSGYYIYMFSLLLTFIALATILHLQFGVTGIANFGLSGLWGFGMYAFAVLVVKAGVPFVWAVILATILSGIVALALGRIILNLDPQSVLVATLSALVIIETLIISEKWLTNGVKGLGPIQIPFDAGGYTKFVYFLILLFFVVLLILYAFKVGSSPFGRLLHSIQDNEPLSQSLGKPTFQQKIIFFTFTSALAGFFGAMSAPVYIFLFPKHMGPELTFTLWIALILGARKRVMGGLVGILATIGLFDVVLETIVPIPAGIAGILYNGKYLLYGLTLVLILMFRPSGILGEKRKKVSIKPTGKLEKKEG
jgi:branched-chain amino acid transport system permease protein